MYTHILFLCIKGWKFFRNQMYHVKHHKSYGSGLTAVIEVLKRKVYVLVHIIIFSLQWVYDILCMMFASKSWKISTLRKIPLSWKFLYHEFLQGFLHNLLPGLPYPGKFPFPGNSPYPYKSSIRKSIFFKSNNKQKQNFQV